MSPNIRARVVHGRLELQEPVELPEGAEVELAVIDMDDDLDDAERVRLHAVLDAALARFDNGDAGVPARR